MKRATNVFIAATLIFLLLLGLSDVAGGVLSHVVYALACIVPTLFAIFYKQLGACQEKTAFLTFDTGRLVAFLPTVAPTVAITFAISAATSFIMSLTLGISNVITPEELGGNLGVALLLHALMPAVLEEALFRYVPLRLVARRSPRGAVILSALFFALVHADFFTVPYALFAGVAFMVLDIALDSIYPSLILHFINNAMSVLSIFFAESSEFAAWFYSTLSVLAVLSLLIIILKRKKYTELLSRALDRGEGYKLSGELLLVVVPCILLAVIRLVGELAK